MLGTNTDCRADDLRPKASLACLHADGRRGSYRGDNEKSIQRVVVEVGQGSMAQEAACARPCYPSSIKLIHRPALVALCRDVSQGVDQTTDHGLHDGMKIRDPQSRSRSDNI